MTRKEPLNPSVASYGGIVAYLEATKNKHNNQGADLFKTLVSLDMPDTKIAKAFGVKSSQTIKKWRAWLLEGEV